MQQNNQQQNNTDSVTHNGSNQNEKQIYQYTYPKQFYNDFVEQNSNQQTPLSAEDFRKIKELQIQLGWKDTPSSYGYNYEDGIYHTEKILEILIKNENLINVENFSFVFGRIYPNEQVISEIYSKTIIKRLTEWDQCKKFKKLQISVPESEKNSLEGPDANFQQLCSAKNLEQLKCLDVIFLLYQGKEEYQPQLHLFSKKIRDHYQAQFQISRQGQNEQQHNEQERIRILQGLDFYLYNLEELQINFANQPPQCKQFDHLSEQFDLISYCMPKLKKLTINSAKNYLVYNSQIKKFTENLKKSSLIKQLECLQIQLPESKADDEFAALAQVIAEYGVNLTSIDFLLFRNSVSSSNLIKIFDCLSSKPLKKLAICFCYNKKIDGSELVKLGQMLTNKAIDEKYLQNENLLKKFQIQPEKKVFFHELIEDLTIKFSDNDDDQNFRFIQNLTQPNKFERLQKLSLYSYSDVLSRKKFLEIVDLITDPQCFQNLKSFQFALAGLKITHRDQYQSCQKFANCQKFSNLEELKLSYENSFMENDDYCAKIAEEISNSTVLKNLKQLYLDFQKNTLLIPHCKKIASVLGKDNRRNQLSQLEEITLGFWKNKLDQKKFIDLNNVLRRQLISEKLRIANLSFGIA
ncbi:hypothetical protein PPERSA_04733 [Pseudocohnilembus persalinus]|uniref:Uncharacterized protein n=1 Tax=Pseudocohnilembus persalinus TaxID=266149 RepID=A0A0V0R4M2_PSEPJ|nr:hypothetical protein PPERSA_04733 [Pseudocohnilembus persalinus]|eukprot:KRX09427.1 hypothetical protein PPERSA_04733 [Pseudocohnilembus persalinus]